MGRHRYTCHLDKNHMEIKSFFQVNGCSVFDAARVGGGFPDLVVGYKGVTYLVEVKDPDKGKLENTQVDFIMGWNGHVKVVTSIEEAKEMLEEE